MASVNGLWTPPEGMLPMVINEWRAFYRKALDTYGTTPTDYRTMYIAQKGRCWICRKAKGIHPDDPKARGGRRLGWDHNHAMGNVRGAVRGLLCTGGDKTCNRVIGWLGRDALARAAAYLASPPARVLFEVDTQRAMAHEQGVELSEIEVGAMALAYLWRAGDYD